MYSEVPLVGLVFLDPRRHQTLHASHLEPGASYTSPTEVPCDSAWDLNSDVYACSAGEGHPNGDGDVWQLQDERRLQRAFESRL